MYNSDYEEFKKEVSKLSEEELDALVYEKTGYRAKELMGLPTSDKQVMAIQLISNLEDKTKDAKDHIFEGIGLLTLAFPEEARDELKHDIFKMLEKFLEMHYRLAFIQGQYEVLNRGNPES